MLNANIPNPLSMWLNIVASIDSGYLVKVLSCVLKICPPTSKVMIESDILDHSIRLKLKYVVVKVR